MQLKSLHASSIEAALERARHYRLLNDPENAESICLDVLDVDAVHQDALIQLILCLTDQFDGGTARVDQARQFLSRVSDEYARSYYAGLICERAARSMLNRRNTRDGRHAAWQWLNEARTHYETAETLSSRECEDAVLRWNACTRMIENRKLTPDSNDDFVVYGD